MCSRGSRRKRIITATGGNSSDYTVTIFKKKYNFLLAHPYERSVTDETIPVADILIRELNHR